jgi:Flp pilus assembly protein TadG
MKTKKNGQVLVLFALLLFVLCGLAALGIDVGYLYSVRHELQRSADAGALAGASAFFDGDWNDPVVRAAADARARDFASRDPVAAVRLDPGGEVAVDFPAQPRIRVTTSRTVNLFFARVFGAATRQVSASASAEAVTVNRRLPCIMPWGIPFPWNDTNGDGLYTPGEDVYDEGCNTGNPLTSFCTGTRIILKVSNKADNLALPTLQQEAGHFFALDFGAGAKTYRDSITASCPGGDPLSIGDSVPLQPGNIVGPTVQGVSTDADSLISRDPSSTWDVAENKPWSPAYPLSNGAWLTSPRLVRVPIYDPRILLSSGKTDIQIAAFAGFWIESCDKVGQQGTVVGRFIDLPGTGESGGSESGGPALRQIRLVE